MPVCALKSFVNTFGFPVILSSLHTPSAPFDYPQAATNCYVYIEHWQAVAMPRIFLAQLTWCCRYQWSCGTLLTSDGEMCKSSSTNDFQTPNFHLSGQGMEFLETTIFYSLAIHLHRIMESYRHELCSVICSFTGLKTGGGQTLPLNDIFSEFV